MRCPALFSRHATCGFASPACSRLARGKPTSPAARSATCRSASLARTVCSPAYHCPPPMHSAGPTLLCFSSRSPNARATRRGRRRQKPIRSQLRSSLHGLSRHLANPSAQLARVASRLQLITSFFDACCYAIPFCHFGSPSMFAPDHMPSHLRRVSLCSPSSTIYTYLRHISCRSLPHYRRQTSALPCHLD